MDTVTLGRTGLDVSAAGLGCGGHSRLGQGYGASRADSLAVVREAIDLGVTFIDTAQVYGTEDIVGEAVGADRDRVVISSKIQVVRPGTSQLGREFLTADEFVGRVDGSLERLRTDRIDILHLHGIMPDQYAYCVSELVPALERLREAGKIRFTGLTERFIHDPQHRMLETALRDDCWDVIMTGLNVINASAVDRVLAPSIAGNVGTLIMFAVRRAIGDPQALAQLTAELVAEGLVDSDAIDRDDPLGFLVGEGGAASVIEGAYRFCRHQPGAHVILTGTGSIDHLRENVASINAGPLDPACIDRAARLFGAIDSVSCN